MDKRKLTTASGRPYYEHENSMSAGLRGALLLLDYILYEKMAYLTVKRIPEIAVCTKGLNFILFLKNNKSIYKPVKY